MHGSESHTDKDRFFLKILCQTPMSSPGGRVVVLAAFPTQDGENTQQQG